LIEIAQKEAFETRVKKAEADLGKLKKQLEKERKESRLKMEKLTEEKARVEEELIGKNAELSDRLDKALLELETKKKEIVIYERKHAKVVQVESENAALNEKVAQMQAECEKLTKHVADLEASREICIKTEANEFEELQAEIKVLQEQNDALEKQYLTDKSFTEFLKDLIQKELAKTKVIETENSELKKGNYKRSVF
jgi:hypothetical protein